MHDNVVYVIKLLIKNHTKYLCRVFASRLPGENTVCNNNIASMHFYLPLSLSLFLLTFDVICSDRGECKITNSPLLSSTPSTLATHSLICLRHTAVCRIFRVLWPMPDYTHLGARVRRHIRFAASCALRDFIIEFEAKLNIEETMNETRPSNIQYVQYTMHICLCISVEITSSITN